MNASTLFAFGVSCGGTLRMSRLAPGVARYCDSGLRTQSRGPLYDNYSDAERRDIGYSSQRPEVASGRGRIDIRCGPPAGYDHVRQAKPRPVIYRFRSLSPWINHRLWLSLTL